MVCRRAGGGPFLEGVVMMMTRLASAAALLLFLLLVVGQAEVGEATTRPVLGILSQAADGPLRAYGEEYIAASYIKFIESAGARVVPLR